MQNKYSDLLRLFPKGCPENSPIRQLRLQDSHGKHVITLATTSENQDKRPILFLLKPRQRTADIGDLSRARLELIHGDGWLITCTCARLQLYLAPIKKFEKNYLPYTEKDLLHFKSRAAGWMLDTKSNERTLIHLYGNNARRVLVQNGTLKHLVHNFCLAKIGMHSLFQAATDDHMKSKIRDATDQATVNAYNTTAVAMRLAQAELMKLDKCMKAVEASIVRVRGLRYESEGTLPPQALIERDQELLCTEDTLESFMDEDDLESNDVFVPEEVRAVLDRDEDEDDENDDDDDDEDYDESDEDEGGPSESSPDAELVQKELEEVSAEFSSVEEPRQAKTFKDGVSPQKLREMEAEDIARAKSAYDLVKHTEYLVRGLKEDSDDLPNDDDAPSNKKGKGPLGRTPKSGTASRRAAKITWVKPPGKS